MDDVLRKRLSPEELDQYDRYDRRASIAGHFVVWPAIAGAISYTSGNAVSPMVCLAIVVVAFPVLVMMGNRAGKIRKLAEDRFAAIMGVDKGNSDKPD